jgi:hypothetical protein
LLLQGVLRAADAVTTTAIDTRLIAARTSFIVEPRGSTMTTIRTIASHFITTFISVTALAACGGAPDEGSADPTPTQGAQASAESTPANTQVKPELAGKVLQSVTKNGHTVQFIETEPGVVFIIESIPEHEEPLVKSTGDASLAKVFSSLSDAPVPEVIMQADQRRVANLAANAAANAAVTAPVLSASHGQGSEFYTSSEQTWFRNNYCNGAQACAQGWDWAFSGTINYNPETFWAWVGSEGTTNATFWLEYYKPQPTILGIPIACGSGQTCGWIRFYSAFVVPGHLFGVTASGASQWQAHLEGAGGGTQVSLSAKH